MRASSPRSPSSRPRSRPTRRCVVTASRSASTTRSRDASYAPSASRPTSVAPRRPIAELLDHTQPDLILLNDDDLTYAKIRLDDRSFDTLLESIATFDESLPRALCWGSAWDMTRDAELPAADFVALVLAGVGSETDLTAVSALLRQAQTAVNIFTSDDARPELAEKWESGLRALVDEAEAGSDHQLALVRAYANAASGPVRLRELIDGEPRRPRGRHRPALDAPHGACPSRRGRRSRDRCRARARQHDLRPGARRLGARDPAARRCQGRGVGRRRQR